MKLKYGYPILALLLLLLSNAGLAVTCTSSTTSVQVQPVQVSRFQPANSVIWVSQPYTVSITCNDTDHFPKGEMAYIYVDPNHEFAHFLSGTNMKLVVVVDGHEYDQGAQRINTPHIATFPSSNSSCLGNHPNNGCRARANTFSFTYSLMLRSTQGLPAHLPSLSGRSISKVFVVDGQGSINACGNHCTASNGAKNYGPSLTGLNNIRYTQCSPTVSIDAGNGRDTVDFGSISITEAKANQHASAHSKPFSITARDNSTNNDCQNLDYIVSFSGTTENGGTVFTESVGKGFGVTISDPAKNNQDIQSGTRVDFVDPSFNNLSKQRTKNFNATLYWLTNMPATGRFSIPVTATITFK